MHAAWGTRNNGAILQWKHWSDNLNERPTDLKITQNKRWKLALNDEILELNQKEQTGLIINQKTQKTQQITRNLQVCGVSSTANGPEWSDVA